MNPKISPFRTSRLTASAWAALLLATVTATFAAAAETAPQPPTPPSVSAPEAAKPAEDREALLARLTKVLHYGSEIGLAKPSKTDVVVALGAIGDERAVPVLAEHLANNENRFLRLRIVRALGWIGGQQAIPVLETALKDNYPPVRKQAADVLHQLTGRRYEYDQTGLTETNDLSTLEASSLPTGKRLEAIADEVAKRRELRQVAAGATVSPEKKKMVEPIDIDLADQPARLAAKTYSDLTGKLVLVSPKISAAGVTCKIEKSKVADAQAALNKALLDAGVLVVELERGVIAFTPADSTKPADKPLKP